MVNIASRTYSLIKDSANITFWRVVWEVKEAVSILYDTGINLYLDALEKRIKRRALDDAKKYIWKSNI